MGDRKELTGRRLREAIPAEQQRGRSVGDLREAHRGVALEAPHRLVDKAWGAGAS
ncbi:hypothetical protein [Thermoflexus sp.]|uniref:hypothetical protein n=1 Tax=Thermoflexus sp. TaxID=1969742 RepID=UPI00262EEDB4|nr:hypothetical protein [Thermoflexus sp.]MCX7691726.1 hypothetical protein [Thermoflexus sp.]